MKKNLLVFIGLALLVLTLVIFVIFAIVDISLSNVIVAIPLLCISSFTFSAVYYYDRKGVLIKAFESEKIELYILLLIGIVVPIVMICGALV